MFTIATILFILLDIGMITFKMLMRMLCVEINGYDKLQSQQFYLSLVILESQYLKCLKECYILKLMDIINYKVKYSSKRILIKRARFFNPMLDHAI